MATDRDGVVSVDTVTDRVVPRVNRLFEAAIVT